MSRKLHSYLVYSTNDRGPEKAQNSTFSTVAARDKQLKQRQRVNHDTHHGARDPELPVLSPGEYVHVGDGPRRVRRSS